MSKSLDLGCGDKPRNPFHADEVYGVDVRDGLGGRIRCADLVVDRIPFDDASFDYVTAHDFIEHLPRIVYCPERRHPFVELMNEVHRVLKPGGLFFSFTPAYPHVEAFRDPTHVNIITFDTFPLYFADPEPYGVIYGFDGAFEVGMNVWRGKHVVSVLRKIESPRLAPRAAPAGTRVSVALARAGDDEAAVATLDSLLAQTHADLEIVDLGTGRAMRTADPRLHRPPAARRAATLPQALNLALPSMSGDYFVLAHAGERYPPDWLAQRVRAAGETGADAVIADPPAAADLGRARTVGGRDACERFGTDACIDTALWNMQLVRSIGFEEFSDDAQRQSARRFLLASRRVAFVDEFGGSTREDAAPPSADAPYTELRLMQLYQEQGLSAQRVRAQKARALASLAELQPAAETGAAFDACAAQRTIDRFVARLALLHVFDPRPRPTPRERLRKLKRDLRQRAEHIRLAFAHR